jgi:hypothetical protein
MSEINIGRMRTPKERIIYCNDKLIELVNEEKYDKEHLPEILAHLFTIKSAVEEVKDK